MWQEVRLSGARSLFVCTACGLCKALEASEKAATWGQQMQGLMR